jgi:amicoumacin kinase
MKPIPLELAAAQYGLTAANLEPMRGALYTHVYAFQRQQREYILRLIPVGEGMDAQTQRSQMVWMAYLAANGVAVPQPVTSIHNHLIESVPTGEGEWLVTAYTRAKGILSEELLPDQWDGPLFRALGKTIGKAHEVARRFTPPEEISYPQWDKGENLFSDEIKNEVWLKEKKAPVLERIKALPKPAEAYGLIHCDLHFGNFFIDVPTKTVTLIDFDDCAYGWFVMDIAVLLFDIMVLHQGSDKDEYGQWFLQHLMKGYREENPMPDFWMEHLPLFLKLLEINIYDQIARYYPGQAGEWGAKFMPGRKERIENDLPYYSEPPASSRIPNKATNTSGGISGPGRSAVR